MKRMRRKNGSPTCRLLHRRHWYKATQSTRIGQDRWRQQKVTVCQLCHAWYTRGEAIIATDKAVEVGGPQ